jgi:hypothetical protein
MSLLGSVFSKKGLRVETTINENGDIITKSFDVSAQITFIAKYGDIYTSEVITFDGKRIVNNGVLTCHKYQVLDVNKFSIYKFNKNFTKGEQIFLSKENNVSIAETLFLKKLNFDF